jgi:hypothetical protein
VAVLNFRLQIIKVNYDCMASFRLLCGFCVCGGVAAPICRVAAAIGIECVNLF